MKTIYISKAEFSRRWTELTKPSADLKTLSRSTRSSRKLLSISLRLKINKGNFEKSIEMYNYALAKDKIPLTSYKSFQPKVKYVDKVQEAESKEE